MNDFTPNPDERRYLPRWEVRNRVLFQLPNSSRVNESTTKDINASGASFFSRQPLQPHQQVKLTIYLSPDVAITVNGHITWSKTVENQESLLGVEFENVDEKIQSKILEHAFELNDQSVMRSLYQKALKNTKKKSLSSI